jgi:ABC-2 type transport system ATP-binding protein
MSEAALKMTNVVKRFGRRTALNGLTLTVPKGAALGLVGSNGAGKTTAMSIAVGILRSQSGQVDLLGDGPFDPRKHGGRVSLMPQDAELPLHARVCDLMAFYGRLQGIPASQSQRAIDEVLDWVHLLDRSGSKIRTLSHGMRRRLVIAQAFLGSPELALLDEPLAGLDPREVVNMREVLRQRPSGQTLVISSHNLHEIERICDHVAFIEQGRVIRQDLTATVTGHAHTIQYRLSASGAPLSALQAALPAAQFTLSDDKLCLSCRYSDSTLAIEQVNAQVLRILLDHGIGLIEVRRGAELEAAYLSQTPEVCAET